MRSGGKWIVLKCGGGGIGRPVAPDSVLSECAKDAGYAVYGKTAT